MENYCGKRLDGRYEMKEIIGVGGMAVVYKAYDNIDDRIVAVKVLKEEFLANEDFRRRFKNESKAIAVLSHPNIVKVYDVSFGDKLQYIVMEYIEGITLKEYIEQQKIVNWKEAVHFVSQILRALQHAHDKGIVHRDIKPQNILLLQDGTIKVTDFGIARFSRGDTRTMTEHAIGSVHYISPEQARGEMTDDKSDIYSVGVVLYEMLTGQLPFQSDSAVSVAIMQLQQEAKHPREINPQVPLGLEQITLHAMRKNAKERYHSAAEMMRDIDEFKRNPSIKFDYSYFVDNAPTKYVSDTVGTSAAAARTSDTPEEGKKTAVKTQNKTMIILLGVIASIVVVAAIVAGIFLATQKKLEVPNFVGKNYAQEIMTDPQNTENFNFEIENTYSTDAEVGTVIKQTPEAGTMLRKGKTIKLYLAYNDEGILIEGIAGLTASEATARLKALGFTVQERLTYEKNMTPGIVAYCSPQEGSYAEKGSLVTIYIASDENPNAVKVPEVLGYNQDIAKQIIESAGFVVGNITQENSDKEAGTVIGQSPDSTEEATLGSKVDLVVSNGVPSESSATITISLPTVSGSAMGTVKIFVNSVLYGTYKDILLKGDAKTFEITGTGADNTFRVFLDDQEILTGKIDFTQVPAKITDVEETPYVVQEIVPSVVGISEQDARKRLNSSGFTNIEVKEEYSATVVKGIVISQTPVNSTSKHPVNEKITLVISKGPAPEA